MRISEAIEHAKDWTSIVLFFGVLAFIMSVVIFAGGAPS